MGMFDRWENFTDHFREGEVFQLTSAKSITVNTAEYGESRMAILGIRREDGVKLYSLFGAAIVAQIDRMEPGELPARVRVERTKNKRGQDMKLLVPEGQEVPTEDIPF